VITLLNPLNLRQLLFPSSPAGVAAGQAASLSDSAMWYRRGRLLPFPLLFLLKSPPAQVKSNDEYDYDQEE
jgi:hypothetical protein